jgi:phosphohistidine phosphatase SixA
MTNPPSTRLPGKPWWPRVTIGGLVVVCVLSLFFWWRCWYGGDTTTLLVLRHADRVPTQDALSAAGQARAQELVRVAQKAGIRGIYHSDTDRSRQTAQPIANALGITPVEIPATDVTALVNHIFANHRGETVLVVGHSNTVPQIITAVGGPVLPDIPDNEFDNLFVVPVCQCWWWWWWGQRATAVNMQYGVASP